MSIAPRKYFYLLLLSILLPVNGVSAGELQESKINPYMLFTYLKDTNSSKILQAKMTNITQTGEVPLPGLTIRFYNDDTFLGEAVTDVTGSANYTIDSSTQLTAGDDGSWSFSATFDGDSLVEETYSELSITDVNIEMTLGEEEGKKFVILSAAMPSGDGQVPVAGEEISVFIPRMFSLLPVGTGMLDDNGTIQIDFPDDLPGDSLGNLTVIGRFNDHYLFGNVEKREKRPWGKPVVKAPPIYRSLWSTLAPKWMIVSLAIMLLGVWGHYTFVIISLIRIKREGKEDSMN
jgi:hypothetical protein